MTISVNLPSEFEARLKALADKSGQSSDAQLRQIIDLGLEELETTMQAMRSWRASYAARRRS